MSMQPFKGEQQVVIEKRDAAGALDFSEPQPWASHATFDTVYRWMFYDDPQATGSWECLSVWLRARGWCLRAKTWA